MYSIHGRLDYKQKGRNNGKNLYTHQSGISVTVNIPVREEKRIEEVSSYKTHTHTHTC